MGKKRASFVRKVLVALLFTVTGSYVNGNPAPVLANNDFPAQIVPGGKTSVVIEKENLDIKFHKGPTYGPDHHLNMPKADVIAHYDLYNDSDQATTVDIAFPVAEGKWVSRNAKWYSRYNKEYLKRILPRKLTVTFQGKPVEVTCDTIDISVLGLAGSEIGNWKKFIVNTFSKDPELALIIRRLRSKPDDKGETEILAKIKDATTRKFGKHFFHKRFVDCWTAMDRGWSDTHLEHAAVACMMPWVDAKFQLKLPNRAENENPFNCLASFKSEYIVMGTKYNHCYCTEYRKWRPGVEKWIIKNIDSDMLKLLYEYSSLPLEKFIINDLARAQEIMYEKFGVPFENCEQMAHFLKDEKDTPLKAMGAFSPVIKKRLDELKIEQHELMAKWHVPDKYISPVSRGLYPIGGNVKGELAIEGPPKYYYNKDIRDTSVKRGRGVFSSSTDYDLFLHLYRFELPIKAGSRGRMTVEYSSTMASDVDIANSGWQTLLTQFQYILKTASYWPKFGGVDIKLTFPKGSIPTIYPETALASTTKENDIYTLSLKNPTENLYVTMVGIKPKDGHYTTVDGISFNEEEIKQIEKKYSKIPIDQWPIYIQVNLFSDYHSMGKTGTAILFHEKMSETAKKFIWQDWLLKDEYKTLAKVLSFEGNTELNKEIIEAIKYNQTRGRRIHPEEAQALRKKIFPAGKKLSRKEALYDFFFEHKSYQLKKIDMTVLLEAVNDPAIAGEAMDLAEIIYRYKERLLDQNSRFDFASLEKLALQNLDNKNDIIRSKACVLIEHFGAVRIIEILEKGTIPESSTQLLDHLGKQEPWLIENYAERISKAVKKHQYKVTSSKLIKTMNNVLNPNDFYTKIAVVNDPEKKLQIRIQNLKSLANSKKSKPFLSNLKNPEGFPEKLKWVLVEEMGWIQDKDSLPFLRKLLRETEKLNEEQFCKLAKAFSGNGTHQDAENLRKTATGIFTESSDWDDIDSVAANIGMIYAKPIQGDKYGFEYCASYCGYKETYEKEYWKSTRFLGAYDDKQARQKLIDRMYPTLDYLIYRGKYHAWDETHKDSELMAEFNREGLDYLMRKGREVTFRNRVGFSRLIANYTKTRAEWLKKYIDSDDPEIRRIAILALGEIKTSESWRMLENLLENPETRIDALQASVFDGRKCIVSSLVKLKKDLLRENSLLSRKRQRRLITWALEKVKKNSEQETDLMALKKL